MAAPLEVDFSSTLTATVADRRTRPRFEIVGRLPGTLTAEREVRLRNVSRSGALIETVAPLQRDTMYNVTIETDQHLTTLRARVCHVRRTHLDDAFLVGLEFIGAEQEELDQLTGTADHVARP